MEQRELQPNLATDKSKDDAAEARKEKTRKAAEARKEKKMKAAEAKFDKMNDEIRAQVRALKNEKRREQYRKRKMKQKLPKKSSSSKAVESDDSEIYGTTCTYVEERPFTEEDQKKMDGLIQQLKGGQPKRRRTKRKLSTTSEDQQLKDMCLKLKAENKLANSQTPPEQELEHNAGVGYIYDEQEEIDRLNAEMANLIQELSANIEVVKKPTFIDSSRASWDEVRERVTTLFSVGMLAQDEMLCHRQSYLYPECVKCSEAMNYKALSTEIKVLSIEGMMTVILDRAECSSCGWMPVVKTADFVQIGLWPLECKGDVFVEFKYMFYTSILQHMSPTISLSSILQTLSFITTFRKSNIFSMKQDVFNYCMSEWRHQEHIYFEQSTSGNLFECPACQHSPHAVHLDGNAKLYRYKAAGRMTQKKEEVDESFFIARQKVDETVAKIMPASNQVDVVKECGGSVFKANNTKGKAHGKKDETGLMLATCRHSFLLKGLDMFRGEIYAYPYTLQKEFPHAGFIATDVMCRYWPWLKRIDPALSEKHKSFLSVFHAKSHSYDCQVSWSGRVIEGAGLSTGETTELANSYMSRHGLITRHMTSDGRRERLKHAAGFWNIRKMIALPKLIKANIKRCMDEIPKLEGKLEEIGSSLNMDFSEIQGLARQIPKNSSVLDKQLTKTQLRIEQLSRNINRYSRTIMKGSDNSKSREKVRRKLRKSKQQLKQLAKCYVKGNSSITMEEIIFPQRNRFPWSSKEVVLTEEQEQAIETYHLLERTKEELKIVHKERNNLLSFWASRKENQDQAIKTFETRHFLTKQMYLCRYYFSEHLQEWPDLLTEEDEKNPCSSSGSDSSDESS